MRADTRSPAAAASGRRDRAPLVGLLVGLGLLAFLLASWVALGPLGGLAHVSDEVAYTLQARLFAAGLRTGPPGDQPSMLLYPFWQVRPRSFAVFPPGWPALLSLGVALGRPWVVNAGLAGLLPGLSFALARAWRRPLGEARLAALVAALSPGVVLLAGSRMAHTSVLVALLAALVVVERARGQAPEPPPGTGRDGLWVWSLAGLGLAYVVLARQLDAALLAGPLLLVGTWQLLARTGRDRALGLGLWLLPSALATGLILLDNHRLTGAALTFPVGPWYDQWVADAGRPAGCNNLGFGPTHGCHPTLGSWGHTPAKALRIAADTVVLLDRLLIGLPGATLLAVVGALRIRRIWVPLWITLAVVGGYGLYWSPGNVYGARFWHPLYLILPVLLAAGLSGLPRRLRSWLPVLMVVVGSMLSLGRASRELAADYWCVGSTLSQLLASEGVDHGSLMISSAGQRSAGWPYLGRPDFVCDPLLDSGAVFQLMDPSAPTGGLQPRHAPRDPAQLRAYLDRYQAGAPAYQVLHSVPTDEWLLKPLVPGGTP